MQFSLSLMKVCLSDLQSSSSPLKFRSFIYVFGSLPGSYSNGLGLDTEALFGAGQSLLVGIAQLN